MIWCDEASSYGNRVYLKKEYHGIYIFRRRVKRHYHEKEVYHRKCQSTFGSQIYQSKWHLLSTVQTIPVKHLQYRILRTHTRLVSSQLIIITDDDDDDEGVTQNGNFALASWMSPLEHRRPTEFDTMWLHILKDVSYPSHKVAETTEKLSFSRSFPNQFGRRSLFYSDIHAWFPQFKPLRIFIR